MKVKKNKQNPINREIDVYGAITTPLELIRETLINFTWGLMGNSIVVFMTKEIDVMVFLNFVLYYLLFVCMYIIIIVLSLPHVFVLWHSRTKLK